MNEVGAKVVAQRRYWDQKKATERECMKACGVVGSTRTQEYRMSAILIHADKLANSWTNSSGEVSSTNHGLTIWCVLNQTAKWSLPMQQLIWFCTINPRNNAKHHDLF